MGTPAFTPGEAHAMACARYGDCLFDAGQEYVQKLEDRWKDLSRPWRGLLARSLGGFLGFGQEIDTETLHALLFRSERHWPEGLTKSEKQVLRLARAVSAYHPGPDGLHPPRPVQMVGEDVALRALRRYAKLFEKTIALPMWTAYEDVRAQAGDGLQGLCEQAYAEPCSAAEAASMWAGDLERGLTFSTIEASPATYTVLPRFLQWVSA